MRAQITSFRSQLLLCLFSFLLFSRFGYAQYSGNIQGVVSDATGAAIGGASVRLRNADTAVEATTITSGSGNYRFSSLPPGRYLVRAEAGGFQAKEINLTLSTSEIQGINITLAVGGATQAVTVTAEAPILDTDDSRIQATLPANTVRDLPQANRNLWDVLAVTPGVVGAGVRAAGTSPGGGNDNFGTQTPQLSANGRSYTGNLVMVDGMNVTSPIQNGNIILAPVPDAVQEASLQANSWDAENNLGSSILIQVTTKSGTNQFHGTGSLFFTNQDLQATPEFQAAVAPFSRKDPNFLLLGFRKTVVQDPRAAGNSDVRSARICRVVTTELSEHRWNPSPHAIPRNISASHRCRQPGWKLSAWPQWVRTRADHHSGQRLRNDPL
jgi:hypothetical protein